MKVEGFPFSVIGTMIINSNGLFINSLLINHPLSYLFSYSLGWWHLHVCLFVSRLEACDDDSFGQSVQKEEALPHSQAKKTIND